MYFGDQNLVRGIIGKYIFPYGQFPFHFDDVFLIYEEAFFLMKSYLFILPVVSLVLGDM